MFSGETKTLLSSTNYGEILTSEMLANGFVGLTDTVIL